MTLYYAGIGSRETPSDILNLMKKAAVSLRNRGWILRSGAAPGADSAFELGAGSLAEIFLPWKDFNGHPSRRCYPTNDALALAAQHHPAWDRCSNGAKLLHARNMHQILGEDLMTPVRFVLCWTKDAKGQGGTGQAIRLARSREIPVYDLGESPKSVLAALAAFINRCEESS